MSKKNLSVLSPKRQKQLSPIVILGSIITIVVIGGLLIYWGSLSSRSSVTTMSYQQLVQEGNRLMDSKKFQEAIKYYQAALEKNPEANDVRTDLGASFHALKQYAEAERELTMVIQKDPNHAYGHYNLGIVYFTQGKNKLAVEEFKAYLKLDPNGPLAGRARTILAKLKNPDFGTLKLPNR